MHYTVGMQQSECKALKKCFRLIVKNLNLETHPKILAYLLQEDVLTEDDLDAITRHKTTHQQNTELYFRLRRCDSKIEPFTKFCQALEENDFDFIAHTLKNHRKMAASNSMKQKMKCVHCLLVENLYPEKIAPSLYEDSELSSGTLEEVTLTEGVSRRAAVKTILKKLVNSQKEKGPGRECVDALAKTLPESCAYLLPHVNCATIDDLKRCTCAKEPVYSKIDLNIIKTGGIFEIKSKLGHFDDLLHLSEHITENNGMAREDDQEINKRVEDMDDKDSFCSRKRQDEAATETEEDLHCKDRASYIPTEELGGFSVGKNRMQLHRPQIFFEDTDNKTSLDNDGSKDKGLGMMKFLAPPKTVRIGSEWDEFHELRDTVREKDEMLTTVSVRETQNCVHCMLMGHLSELSSGTLEEATSTEGVSRRAAVKIIFKKVVNDQKHKVTGRKSQETLPKALREIYEHLQPNLDGATVNDLQICTCAKGGGCTNFKVKERNHGRIEVGQNVKGQEVKLGGQKVFAEGHELKMLQTPGLIEISEKEYRGLLVACSQMHILADNAKWEQFEKYQGLFLARFPDNVDLKLHLLLHMVNAHCNTNTISNKTHEILDETKQLIPKSNYPLLHEFYYLGTLALVSRKEMKYGIAEDHTKCICQKLQLLAPKNIGMNQKRRDAEYLIHQFQNKFTTNSVPEGIFQRIEDLLLCSLDHAASLRQFLGRSESTAKYTDDCYRSGRISLIHLAQLYLRCCVTFKGTNEDFATSSKNIAKAEQCLQKVVERWEGISSRTEGEYLLTMSDLHLRKKQYFKALEFANEALVLCSKRNQLSMVEWAERRIRYLQRRIGVNGVDVDRSEVSSGSEAGLSSGVDSS